MNFVNTAAADRFFGGFKHSRHPDLLTGQEHLQKSEVTPGRNCVVLLLLFLSLSSLTFIMSSSDLLSLLEQSDLDASRGFQIVRGRKNRMKKVLGEPPAKGYRCILLFISLFWPLTMLLICDLCRVHVF